jgi:2-C-methyl-D-erythritol 4-phosphate cytidylyltransferase
MKEETSGRVELTLSRERKWFAQTPQMFKLGALGLALQRAVDDDAQLITDESSAIEAMGMQPMLVKGDSTNLKITYPEDFEIADALLRARQQAKD